MSERVRHCCVCEKIAIIEQTEPLSSSMAGWLVLSSIHENEQYECHTFCSLDCLNEWLKKQQGSVPDIFEMSFQDNE